MDRPILRPSSCCEMQHPQTQSYLTTTIDNAIMFHHRVFLGAPSKEFLLSNNSERATFQWRTISPPSTTASRSGNGDSLFIQPDAYEAAGIRISNFYQNTIFHDELEDHHGTSFPSSQSQLCTNDLNTVGETTAYTWPPTLAQGNRDADSRADATMPSFLLHDSGALEAEPDRGGEETQHSSPSISQSLSYSRSNLDLSHSLALFPSFHFNPNRLSSLGRAAAGQRSADVGDGGRDDAAALEAPGGTTRVVLVALGSE